MHISWWDAVNELPATHRFVVHEPETPRYARARQKLRYVLRQGVYLGCAGDIRDEGHLEIAVWAPPDHGGGPGYSCCFRLFIEHGVATGAVLFCFYDGTDSSPGISTLEEARAFAHENGFAEEMDDGRSD